MTGLDLEPVVRTGAAVVTDEIRVRVWTRQAARDLAYCLGVLIWSVAGFGILVSGVAVTATFLPLVVGMLVWVGFVYAVRWTTRVDPGLTAVDHLTGGVTAGRVVLREFLPPDDLDC